MAEAMIQRHDLAGAREELKRAMLRSEQLGMQPLSARAHYLLAITERDPAARPKHNRITAKWFACWIAWKKIPGRNSCSIAPISKRCTSSPHTHQPSNAKFRKQQGLPFPSDSPLRY